MIEDQNNKGKYIFGVVKVGDKGQIVIPKEAREIFGIKPGDTLMMFGDIKQGLAMCKTKWLQPFAEELFRGKEQNDHGDE